MQSEINELFSKKAIAYLFLGVFIAHLTDAFTTVVQIFYRYLLFIIKELERILTAAE